MDAKNILKGELKRYGISYARLGELIKESETNIAKKISRGGFSADWFVTALRAIGAKDIRLE